jgi:ribosomal protein S14
MIKDTKQRNHFKHEEAQLVALGCLEGVNFTESENFIKAPKRVSLVSVRNRCLFTGKSRSILSKFRLSRNKFREYALRGFITGLRKAVW